MAKERDAKIRLTAETGPLQKGLEATQKTYEKFAKTAKESLESLTKNSKAFEQLTKSSKGLRDAFAADIKQFQAYRKSADEVSKANSVITKNFNELQKAAEASKKSFKQLSLDLGDNAKGLNAYGKAATDAQGSVKKLAEAVDGVKFDTGAKQLDLFSESTDRFAKTAKEGAAESAKAFDAIADGSKALGEVTEQAGKAEGGLKKLFGQAGNGLKAFGWVADVAQRVAILTTAVNGLASASGQFIGAFSGGGFDRIPETLALFNAVGVGTGSLEQLSLLKDAFFGNQQAAKAFGISAVAAITQFESSLTQVGTVFSGTREELEALGRDIQGLVNGPIKNLVSSTEALAGQYQVLSGGFTDAAKSQQVLNAGLKLSVVGYNDSGSTLELLVKTMRAYGFESSRASQTAAELNAIVENGITTIPQLSQVFGATATVAAQAGLSIDELGAAVATLTAKGTATPSALTGIEALLRNIISKTPQAEAALAKLSKETGNTFRFDLQELRTKGLVAMLQELQVATKGNASTLREIIPESRAFSTALGLMSENGEAFAETAEKMSKVSTENFQGLFEDVAADRSKRFEAIVNRAQELLIEFGRSLTPMFESGIKALEGFLNVLNAIPDPIKNMVGATILVTLAAKQFAGGLGTLAGTFVDVVKQVVALRAINLLFTGELLNEIKIIKFRVAAQNDLAGAFKQAVGLNRDRAASLAEAIAWEQKDAANQKGFLQVIKEKIFAKNVENAADVASAKAKVADATATGASTVAEEANIAARAKNSGIKQLDLGLQVATTQAEVVSTAATNANTTALALNETANKGLLSAIAARFKAAQASARFTQLELNLEQKNTAVKLSSVAAEKAKLLIEKLSLANLQKKTTAIAVNAATQAKATVKKVVDTTVSAKKLAIDTLSTKNLALNTKALQLFSATLVKDTFAKIANIKATVAASGAGAALAVVTGGLSTAFTLLTKAAIAGTKAMAAFLLNPAVLIAVGALAAGMLVFREVTSGATGQVREANKTLNEIINTAANAQNQFTKTAEAFRGLQDEFAPDGRRKAELAKEEVEKIEAREKERERLIKEGLDKGQTFEQAEKRADRKQQNFLAGMLDPRNIIGDGVAGATELTSIIAGRIQSPMGGRLEVRRRADEKDQAVRDGILGFETTSTGIRGRSMTGFDGQGETIDAILPTIDRLNKGLGVTGETAEKARQGFALTGDDLKREKAAYEEIRAPLDDYIAGKEKELEKTKDPARRAAIAADIRDLNEQADAYKAAFDEGEKYLQVQGQIAQRLAVNATAGGVGGDFRSGFEAQYEAARDILDETLALAEKGTLDDINKLDDAAARYAEQVALGFEEGISNFQTPEEAGAFLRELRDRTITRNVEGEETEGSALTTGARRELTIQIADFEQQASDARIKVIENENAVLEKESSLRIRNAADVEETISANNLKASNDRLSTLDAQIAAFKEYGLSTVELEKQAAQQRELIRLQELENSFNAFERDNQKRLEIITNENRQNQILLAQKAISQEEAAQRGAAASVAESQSSLTSIEGQIAAARAAGETTVELEKDAAKIRDEIQLKQINETERLFQRQLDLKKLSLDNEVGAVRLSLQAETDLRIQAQEAAIQLDRQLVDSRNSVLNAQSELEINRLGNAQQRTADQVEQARIGVQIAEARGQQQERQFEIEQQQLETQFKMNKLGLDREVITNRIALLENQVAQQKLAIELSEARRNKVSQEEITALEQQGSLLEQQGEVLGQQGDQLQDTIKAQDELNSNALAELSIRGQMAAENGVMAVQEAKLQEMTAQMEKQQKIMAVQVQLFEAQAVKLTTAINAQQQFLSLEQQLLKIRQDTFQSGQDFVEGQFDILLATTKDAKERRRLEKEIGQTRLSMLRDSQKLEKLNLEINLQQMELALERKKIENDIARVKSEADIKQAQAEVKRQEALRDAGKATDLDVEAANAGLEGAIAQSVGVRIEGSFLGREEQLLGAQANQQRQALDRTQSLQSDQALLEYAGSLPRGNRERRQIERQFRNRDNRNARLGNARGALADTRESVNDLGGLLGDRPDFEAMYQQYSQELGGGGFSAGPTRPGAMEAEFAQEVQQRHGGELSVTGGAGTTPSGPTSLENLQVIAVNSGLLVDIMKSVQGILAGDPKAVADVKAAAGEPAQINIQITQSLGEGGTTAMADDAKRQMIEMLRRDRQEIEQAGRGG